MKVKKFTIDIIQIRCYKENRRAIAKCSLENRKREEIMFKRRLIASAVVLAMLICMCAAFAACNKEDKTYTVTYDSRGGSEVSPSSGVVVIEQSPETTREGYEFTGWYTDPDLTQKVEFPYTVTGDTTLYAGWEEVVGVPDATGADVFNAALNGVSEFAVQAADAVASDSFNIGADVTVKIDQLEIKLSLAASVDAAVPSKNQAKIQIDKNGKIYLGIYLYNNLLYINDGTALRRFSLTAEKSNIAPDLAGAISDAVTAFTGTGETVKEQFDSAYKDFNSTPVYSIVNVGAVKTLVLSLVDAYSVDGGGYETDDILNSLLKKDGFSSLLDIIKNAGVDISAYDEYIKLVLGYTYTEIAEGGYSKEATPFADIRLGAEQGVDGMIDKLWISRTLGESVISLTVSNIVVEQGYKAIFAEEDFKDAKAGALHITGESYIGETLVYSDISLAVDLTNQDGNKIVIKGGSAPGLNDYFTVVYDGAAVIKIEKGQDADGDKVLDTFTDLKNTEKGSMVWQYTAKFCELTGFKTNLSMPDNYGFSVYFPALDFHKMLKTLIPLVEGLLNGDEAEAAALAEEGTESSGFDIGTIIERIIVDEGIGFNVDLAFIEGLANIDIWAKITEIMPTIDTVLGREPDIDKLVTNLIGAAFEGKTGEQIADDNSIDIIFSLPESEAFTVGMDLKVYDKTRPEAGQVSYAKFDIGFCDEPVIEEGFSDYGVILNAVTKGEEVKNPLQVQGEEQFSLLVVLANSSQSAVIHGGNLQYYLGLVSALIEIAGYGDFM